MALRGHLLALLVLIALAAAAVVASDGRNQHHGTSAPLDLVPAAPDASLAERARDDRHRHGYITSKLASRGGRRGAVTTEPVSRGGVLRRAVLSRPLGNRGQRGAVSMPLSSGAYTGTGQYFVRFLVGRPAQQFLLVPDTGSDLTWVKCRAPGAASPPGKVFRPADSKSWAPIPCSSDTCKLDVPFSLANCPAPASPCSYDYRYKEGSASARGVVGTESVTVAVSGGSNQNTTLDNVVLGCSTTNVGRSFASADGVLSLGNSKISFATGAAARFGGRFSYCLVDHLAPRDVTGYLAFGPGRETPRSQTPLLLDPEMPFYTVTVQAIKVAGVALNIPREVWDVKKGGGVILDSGMTLTMLASPAYKAVVKALSKHLEGVPRARLEPFEYCYNWAARRPGAPEIPKLVVEFAGSALFEPPAKSYVIDAAPGVKCIGLQEGEWPGVSVFGNILQQEHLWEFDLKNRLVRFMPSTCTK